MDKLGTTHAPPEALVKREGTQTQAPPPSETSSPGNNPDTDLYVRNNEDLAANAPQPK